MLHAKCTKKMVLVSIDIATQAGKKKEKKRKERGGLNYCCHTRLPTQPVTEETATPTVFSLMLLKKKKKASRARMVASYMFHGVLNSLP